MIKVDINNLSQSQRDRLTFIELRIRFLGEIRRQDLISRFGIQMAAATRDIATYKELAPHNLSYDTKSKIYLRGNDFRPLFDFPSDRVLSWISKGIGDGEPVRFRSIVPCEMPSITCELDMDILSELTCAIHRHSVAVITYSRATPKDAETIESDAETKEIVPFALFDSGFHWCVRAFDREVNKFRDFTLRRFQAASVLNKKAEEHEMSEQDIQWNRIVELELVAHPVNNQPGITEMIYGMKKGQRVVKVRAALAAYLLRRWNVDCSEKHSLQGAKYELWLKNPQALYGVTKLYMAPGYYMPSVKQ